LIIDIYFNNASVIYSGVKEVWIIFCSNTDSDKWRTSIVAVEDGGNCYFNFKVNLYKKAYYELEINYDFQ